MTIRVESEVGPLRRVLLHRPGREIDWMEPVMMEELLFDDILHGEQARREHDRFRRVLEKAGVETLEAETLLAEVLESEAVRGGLFDELERRCGISATVIRGLEKLSTPALAEALIGGVRRSTQERPHRQSPFGLAPLPNYFFQRDPQVVLGDRVLISSMATEAREREPLLARALFEHHPALADRGELFALTHPLHGDPEFDPRYPYPALEGGDVLVPNSKVLIVGISERTNRRGVEVMADYFRRQQTSFRQLILVELPPRRSYMHLDTVFTFIDRQACLAHLPVIEPRRPESAHVYRVDLEAPDLSFTLRPSLLEALSEVGIDLEVVPCGGANDFVEQEREQWTDGANAFAVAPGVILLYRRNRRTVEELASRGWRVVTEEGVLAGDEPLLGAGRTVVTIRGNELSRARGGPRCMTMPLERQPLDHQPLDHQPLEHRPPGPG